MQRLNKVPNFTSATTAYTLTGGRGGTAGAFNGGGRRIRDNEWIWARNG